MFFRQYSVLPDGDFCLENMKPLTRGEYNYFSEADNFLTNVPVDRLPTIEIRDSDNIEDEKLRNTLQKMFFTRQLHFFVHHLRKVMIVDKDYDNGEVETFGVSVPEDVRHAQEMGLIVGCDLDHYTKPSTTLHLVYHYLYKLGSKNFWIERWNGEFLVIHVTRKKVSRYDVVCVTT